VKEKEKKELLEKENNIGKILLMFYLPKPLEFGKF
jgi:hypothetical protein